MYISLFVLKYQIWIIDHKNYSKIGWFIIQFGPNLRSSNWWIIKWPRAIEPEITK
jgi:hypothetical protein